jgi:hypothetical protein
VDSLSLLIGFTVFKVADSLQMRPSGRRHWPGNAGKRNGSRGLHFHLTRLSVLLRKSSRGARGGARVCWAQRSRQQPNDGGMRLLAWSCPASRLPGSRLPRSRLPGSRLLRSGPENILINLQPPATNSGLEAAQKNKVLAQRDAEVFSCAEMAAEGKGMDLEQAL